MCDISITKSYQPVTVVLEWQEQEFAREVGRPPCPRDDYGRMKRFYN